MIHATGIPFFNPLLSMGGVPFPWALPTQGSPPNSPPSSPVSNTSVWHRPQPARAASFTIDAILGRHQQEAEQVSRSLAIRREERLSRQAPYPSVSGGDQGNNAGGGGGGNGGLHSSSSSSSGGSSAKAKVKRVRTIFTAEQLERLEAEFARQQYMVGPERLYLAAALNLTEAQVKVWFQNRRIKWRKQYMEQQHAKLANSHDSAIHTEDSSGESLTHADDRISSSSPLVEIPSSPSSPAGPKDDLNDDVVVTSGTTSQQETTHHKKQHLQQQQQHDLQNSLPSLAGSQAYPSYLAATLTAAYAEHQSEPADLSTTPTRAK